MYVAIFAVMLISLFSLDESVFIGMSTKLCVRKKLAEGDISPAQKRKFYDSVRAFYERAWEYALDNLPLDDVLLKHASLVNFNSREEVTFVQVEYFVER